LEAYWAIAELLAGKQEDKQLDSKIHRHEEPSAAKPPVCVRTRTGRQPKFEPQNKPNTRKRELPATAEPTARRRAFPSRFFMPRKDAEVAESVELLIFTSFRFIPRMKRCHGFMEEENGGSGAFPGNHFSATSALLRGNAFPGAAMPRRADSRARETPA
jgi:hypothetical protein